MKDDEAKAGAPAPSSKTTECVLVVDDEPVSRLLLDRLFSRAGLAHVTVASGAEARHQLSSRRFDLLLTDKNLGDESGVDLAVFARKLDPDVGVILITGYASVSSAEALFKLGVDGYVTKPFELPLLLERIHGARRLRHRAASPPGTGRRRVLLGDLEPPFRDRVVLALSELGCELLPTPSTFLEGIRATPAPEVIIAAARRIEPQVRRELFLLRAGHPSLRVAVVGEPTSIEDTLTAIGVAAHHRLSPRLEAAELLAALSALLR